MRIFSLRHAHRVVQGCGQMHPRRQQQAQVQGCMRLLCKSRRGNDGCFKRAGQRNAQAAEQSSAKPRALAADAEDGCVSSLPTEVQQEGNWRLDPSFGRRDVHVAVCVSLRRQGYPLKRRDLGEHSARDEFVAGAHYAADRNARHPASELPIP